MCTDLFAVCCTADVPEERIDNFLEQTYRNSREMDCQPSLFLVKSLKDLDGDTVFKATQPPTQPFESPFTNKSLEDIARILSFHIGKIKPNTLDPSLFAVLDERSLESDSGLIVQIKDDIVDSVRVHFDTINAELIRIQMITFDIDETRELTGDDGVLRTKPPTEDQRGKPAPRKKLG